MKFNNKNKPEEEQAGVGQNDQAAGAENKITDDVAQNEGPLPDQEKKLEELKSALQESNDKYLRLVAEFDNFRKRNARERNELIKSAGEDIIKSLLDILDDAERAEQQLEKSNDLEAMSQGVALIFSKLRNVLSAKGLKKMESKGEDFNPEFHEAITEIPAPSEDQSGKVIDEVQAGYCLNDKIIRHAKVVVGK
ncbi:MAG TPA: nucleotide exchange factor GrpE [Edaphocola sp.]|nr:nucleotide exchange factor GrpE [Edaphocola sp.]